MKTLLPLLASLLCACPTLPVATPTNQSQDACGELRLEHTAVLPVELHEVSGLEVDNNGRIWAINDSGNSPILYHISLQGEILNEYLLPVVMFDWEDMAVDGTTLYVGDIGDYWSLWTTETRHREFIEIVKVSIKGSIPVVEEIFQLTYPEETQNAEAMIVQDGLLTIFTKGITTQIYTAILGVDDELTYLGNVTYLQNADYINFVMPYKDEKKEPARLLVHFAIPLVTGADILNNLLAIRTYSVLHVVGTSTCHFEIGTISNGQGESISWLDDTHFLVASEVSRRLDTFAWEKE